jgi:hypothetical protein
VEMHTDRSCDSCHRASAQSMEIPDESARPTFAGAQGTALHA